MASWKGSHPQQDDEEEDDDDDDEDDDNVFSRRSFFQRLIIQEAQEEDDGYTEEEDDEDEDESHLFDANDGAEFSVALQELKSIRTHLYSAAEYCESSYIYSAQKQAIFENLKDYSVKALVNAVDHVGTVASKLDDLLSKRTKEISVVEFNVSRLSQRLQACHDKANCEGLNHYQYVKRRPRYDQHYALAGQSPLQISHSFVWFLEVEYVSYLKSCQRAEILAGDSTKNKDKRWIIVKKMSQAGKHQVDAASDSNGPTSQSWHMASETPSVSSSQSTPTAPYVNRSTSSNFRGDKKAQGFLSRSLSGGQFSLTRNSPNSITSNQILEPVQSRGASKSLSSLLSLDETKRHGQQTHKKGLLSAFLGRTKSGKPKRLSTLTSFKQ